MPSSSPAWTSSVTTRPRRPNSAATRCAPRYNEDPGRRAPPEAPRGKPGAKRTRASATAPPNPPSSGSLGRRNDSAGKSWATASKTGARGDSEAPLGAKSAAGASRELSRGSRRLANAGKRAPSTAAEAPHAARENTAPERGPGGPIAPGLGEGVTRALADRGKKGTGGNGGASRAPGAPGADHGVGAEKIATAARHLPANPRSDSRAGPAIATAQIFASREIFFRASRRENTFSIFFIVFIIFHYFSSFFIDDEPMQKHIFHYFHHFSSYFSSFSPGERQRKKHAHVSMTFP